MATGRSIIMAMAMGALIAAGRSGLGVLLVAVMLAGCTPFVAFHAGTFRVEAPPPLRVPDRPQ